MALKKFFFLKTYKKSPSGWGRPQTPLASVSGGGDPGPLSVIRLNYTSLVNSSPNLDIFALS